MFHPVPCPVQTPSSCSSGPSSGGGGALRLVNFCTGGGGVTSANFRDLRSSCSALVMVVLPSVGVVRRPDPSLRLIAKQAECGDRTVDRCRGLCPISVKWRHICGALRAEPAAPVIACARRGGQYVEVRMRSRRPPCGARDPSCRERRSCAGPPDARSVGDAVRASRRGPTAAALHVPSELFAHVAEAAGRFADKLQAVRSPNVPVLGSGALAGASPSGPRCWRARAPGSAGTSMPAPRTVTSSTTRTRSIVDRRSG